jgi:hypothetical protein
MMYGEQQMGRQQLVKNDLIFDSFVFLCMFLYTCLYGAMTVSICLPAINTRPIFLRKASQYTPYHTMYRKLLNAIGRQNWHVVHYCVLIQHDQNEQGTYTMKHAGCYNSSSTNKLKG